MASSALLKFLPEDGNPLKFPSTYSTIPFGAMIPSGVAIHNMKSLLPGVTKYAPTKSLPRNVSPYSAGCRCDVTAISLIRVVIQASFAHLAIDC